jgi:hypothetical protein
MAAVAARDVDKLDAMPDSQVLIQDQQYMVGWEQPRQEDRQQTALDQF